MTSEMAVEDMEDLAGQGIVLTPREMVKLNALGVKAEHNSDSYSFYALPRCVFLGDSVVLREPSIGHEIWYDMVSRAFNIDDPTTEFCLRAYMMSMECDELPKWDSIKKLTETLQDFIRTKLSKYTLRQLMNVVDYCQNGNNALSGEEPYSPSKEDDETENDCEVDENTSITVGVVRECQSLSLGIPLKDIYSMTKSAVQSVIQRVYREKGIDVDKTIRDRAIGEYYVTLEHIKKNHLKDIEKHG